MYDFYTQHAQFGDIFCINPTHSTLYAPLSSCVKRLSSCVIFVSLSVCQLAGIRSPLKWLLRNFNQGFYQYLSRKLQFG